MTSSIFPMLVDTKREGNKRLVFAKTRDNLPRGITFTTLKQGASHEDFRKAVAAVRMGYV